LEQGFDRRQKRKGPQPAGAISGSTLEIVSGPAAGQRLAPDAELLIGRSEQGPGALGGDPELSRRHALLRRLPDGGLLVEDLDSMNGTWVNGTRVPAPTLLAPGDEVAVGASVLRVRAAPSPSPSPSPGAVPAEAPRPRQAVLRVFAGWAPGSRIPVMEPLVLGNAAVGREEFGGDPAVAPEHARVTPLGDGRILLEDLGSPAGTLIDGVPIPAPTVLSAGDRFQLGDQTLEFVEVARQATPEMTDSKVAGGVRRLPEGLFERIAGRAPVTKAEVFETYAFALGWACAANLLIRALALESADVPYDLRAIRPLPLALATLLPVTFNAVGFAKIFRRPDYRSVRRYLIPTFGAPALFVAVNLILINHSGLAEVLTTVALTVVPILICAPLMLRLRRRVAMERLREVRG
jgi:pSer/pThr/pTyr-binding forkhead associated (FHA) protein